MLRAVVAVVLGAALLATTLPAVETAKRERTATQVGGTVERLESAITDLQAREQATVEGGARRVVTVRAPHRGWSHAGVDYIAIGGRPSGVNAAREEPTVAWRISGGEERHRRLADMRVEAAGMSGNRPLVLRKPGVHRLELELVWRGGERRVLVSRAG